MTSGGEPPWFAAAIARELDHRLLPITNDIQTLKNDMQDVKTDVENIKADVQTIKNEMRDLKEVQGQVHRIAAIVSISNLGARTPRNSSPIDML